MDIGDGHLQRTLALFFGYAGGQGHGAALPPLQRDPVRQDQAQLPGDHGLLGPKHQALGGDAVDGRQGFAGAVDDHRGRRDLAAEGIVGIVRQGDRLLDVHPLIGGQGQPHGHAGGVPAAGDHGQLIVILVVEGHVHALLYVFGPIRQVHGGHGPHRRVHIPGGALDGDGAGHALAGDLVSLRQRPRQLQLHRHGLDDEVIHLQRDGTRIHPGHGAQIGLDRDAQRQPIGAGGGDGPQGSAGIDPAGVQIGMIGDGGADLHIGKAQVGVHQNQIPAQQVRIPFHGDGHAADGLRAHRVQGHQHVGPQEDGEDQGHDL